MKQHIQQQVQQATEQLAAAVRKIEAIKLPDPPPRPVDPPPDPRPVLKPIMEATQAELVRSAEELAKCTDAFNQAVELARQRAAEQKAREAAAAEAARQAAEAERKRQAELLAQALAQAPAPKVPANQIRPEGDADVNAQASIDAHGKQGVTCGASGIGDLKPTYPAACVRRGEEGVVTLEWQVLASGKCGWVKIIKSSGNETLDDAAVATVKRAPYRPARSLGMAVDSTMKKTFRFKIVDR